MQGILNHRIHFHPAVRAYRRGGRTYFVNTNTGSWAVLSSRYAKAIAEGFCSETQGEDFQKAYESLSKAMIISDARYPEKKLSTEVKPLLVKFQTTGECNFHCVYCFNDKSIRTHVMNRETMNRAVDYVLANPYAANGVNFSIYGGEPLMERELLYDTILYIREKEKNSPNVRINIITNGVLLTEKDVDFLRENHVQVSFSFDGLPEFQNANRRNMQGEPTSEAVLRGISLFKGYREMCVLATVTRNMSAHLLDIVTFLDARDIPAVEFLPLRMLGQAEGREDISVDTGAYIRSLKAIIDAIEDGKIERISVRAVLRMLLPLETGQTLHGELGIRRCGSGRNVISINYDGTITGCDMMPPAFTPVIGDVWNGITKLEKLDGLLKPYGKVSPNCNSCPWTMFCRSGCTGASGSDGGTCNSRHLLSCAINKAIYPYLLEKLATDGGRLHEYFRKHTTEKKGE